MAKQIVSLDRINQLLAYDCEMGRFFRKTTTGGRRAGNMAGTQMLSGYRQISVDGVYYFEHRLAWYVTNGYYPEQAVDHINRVRNDNRIANLRLATRSENSQNLSMLCSNTSGIRGVTFDNVRGLWIAQIKQGGKNIQLGRYETKLEAAAARMGAEKVLFRFIHNTDTAAS